MAGLNQAQLQAAAEFGTEAMRAFDQGGSFPAETVIAAVARMAGSFLLRSLGLSLTAIEPGAVVLSESANQHGPRLVEILSAVLEGIGVKLDPSRLQAAQAAGRGPGVPFLQTQKRLEEPFVDIRDKHGLSDAGAADSAAAATAVLIKNCSQLLDPHVGFGLAVYGFIEGSKTAPALAGSA